MTTKTKGEFIMKKLFNTIMARRRSLLIDGKEMLVMLEMIDRINDCYPILSASKVYEYENDPRWLVEFQMRDERWDEMLKDSGYQFILMAENVVLVKREVA